MSIFQKVKLIEKQAEIAKKFVSGHTIDDIAKYYRSLSATPKDIEELLRAWIIHWHCKRP